LHEIQWNLTETRARFFEVDVTDSDSLKAAIDGAAAWAKENAKPIGGLIPAAGVGLPAKLLDKDLNPVAMEKLDFVIGMSNLKASVSINSCPIPGSSKRPDTCDSR
jgi:hypothetical protein